MEENEEEAMTMREVSGCVVEEEQFKMYIQTGAPNWSRCIRDIQT
jgi:hypothetical protein